MAQTPFFPDWHAEVVFSDDGPRPTVLLEDQKVKAVMAGLEAGQQIPPHPEGLGVYHFLEGSGWMVIDGERLPVGDGTTIIAPSGASRGIEAETRLAFLAVRVA